MSITSVVKNKLAGVFNLLGVVVTRKRPIITTGSYGSEIVSGYTEASIIALPHVENVDVLEIRSMGDVNSGSVYFAIKDDEDVKVDDIIVYINKDYKVVRVQEYSWGGVVMKSLETKVVGQES